MDTSEEQEIAGFLDKYQIPDFVKKEEGLIKINKENRI